MGEGPKRATDNRANEIIQTQEFILNVPGGGRGLPKDDEPKCWFYALSLTEFVHLP